MKYRMMKYRMMKILRNIWCTVFGHAMWECFGEVPIHVRDGRRYFYSGFRYRYCSRCNKTYIVEDE